jgi:3alpha(or 20beta)-hydroxysteroid dehydrogenase
MGTEKQGRVAGKVVVITGASRGMGAAEAAALAKEGAIVLATDILPPEQTVEGVFYHPLDVSNSADWQTLATHIRDEYGHVDALINNAGITSRQRLGQITLDDWHRVLAVNTTGPLLGIQSLSPLMPQGSSIVNIASIAAVTGHFPAAYTASKWALRGLSRSASLELGEQGIRVNTILPGAVVTAMSHDIPESVSYAMNREIPLGRLGSPQDLTGLVVFLVSDESAFISGAEIPVDGGHTSQGGMKGLSDAMREAGN